LPHSSIEHQNVRAHRSLAMGGKGGITLQSV
jgi:hypothetical protein